MTRSRSASTALALTPTVMLLAACASQPPAQRSASPAQTSHPPAPEIKTATDADDRLDSDRKLDAGRHPAEVLAFIGVRPGMKVAEIGAGGGYTTELLARVVGPTGVVYAENPPFLMSRPPVVKAWEERLARPMMKNVVRADRPFDDPFPPEARDLDAVINFILYHDTVWMEPVADRDKMNRAIFAALKPGGVYVIVDHSGRPGTGTSEVKTLHRIEEPVVRQEIERAGFRLDASADFLRNPNDARDWNAAPGAAKERRGTSDRFVLRFVKP